MCPISAYLGVHSTYTAGLVASRMYVSTYLQSVRSPDPTGTYIRTSHPARRRLRAGGEVRLCAGLSVRRPGAAHSTPAVLRTEGRYWMAQYRHGGAIAPEPSPSRLQEADRSSTGVE